MTTAVILAGGQSRRMGRDKLTLTFSGQTLLERAATHFSEKFDRVFLSVAAPGKYESAGFPLVYDIHKGCGPMSGLHACFTQLDCPKIFFTAADLPYASAEAALKIVELAQGFDAAVMTDSQGRPEPLFGCYSKNLLPAVENLLAQGIYKMSMLLNNANTRIINKSEIGSLWDNKMLLNINYPDDYQKLKHTEKS